MFVRKRTIERLRRDLDHAFGHIKRLDQELFTNSTPPRHDIFGHTESKPTTAGTINAILEHLGLDIDVQPSKSRRTVAVERSAKKEGA